MFSPLLCCLIFLFPLFSLAYEDPSGNSCDGTTYYAPNSTFSSNLDTALQTLQNTTASSGFATTTSGSINQTVTALALCRATINPSDCQLCIDVATSGIRNVCPNGTAAQVWYTLCMLRYSHRNFVNKTDYTLIFSLAGTFTVPDPDIYDAKVRRLMQNLSSTAGASEKRYAVGRTTAPENLTLYGYVDCTRDIDGDGFGTVVLAVLVLCAVKWRKRDEVETGGSKIVEEENEEMSEGIGTRSFMYDLEVLVAATGNFCLANRLGAGGFGTVYKGMMANGEEIAVKKLVPGSTQGIEEFSNEVRLLLKLQHRNLVRLFGCCVEGENRLLVYEYLQNKSLDHFIFDKSKSALLDWPKRYNVIIGVARGLLYLHEDSQLKIIHRDIKASNILLDELMNPKISDFGLAKLFKDEQTHHRTRRIVGTFGYMAPEYATRGFMSSKIDVFSFGVLILEIISGRRNYDMEFDEQDWELLKLAWRLEEEGQLTDLVDVTIGSFPQDQVLKCIRIGLLCCQQSIRDRPTMSSTVLMLSNDSVTMPIEGTHGYQNIRDPVDPHNNINAPTNPENESFSKNSITFSSANGR
ncbi:putative receptor-like protein kinase At4g00960 [Vitis riparia]|uniref:putative receptor-like protein kinase At4g00960 n=1 Tax=Vitis riparia TaxID=96939 RepID=UPI00155A5015|nr:putative receptor-like protein kinase At4g00960 [Vitis riparia]